MARFGKLLFRLLEKVFGQYYEGPEPPERLRFMAIAAANENADMTRLEWVEFAAAHAENSYRIGFLRGMEYVERDPDWFKTVDPELAADALNPEWRWEPYRQVDYPDDPPPTTPLDEEALRVMMQRHNAKR